MAGVVHIRKTDDSVKDRRFRSRVKYANKLRPVLCGADSSRDDVSRSDAEHFLKHANIKPEWAAGLCADCVTAIGGR